MFKMATALEFKERSQSVKPHDIRANGS